jgi:Bacterial regulatory proteins, luxR family
VAGCTNKDIATPLGIAERTVKAHVAKLLRKVGVSNRVMLSMHAITHSLVPSIDEEQKPLSALATNGPVLRPP